MLRYKKEEVEWLEYELLADCRNMNHRVFLRQGGYSDGPYASLNFSEKEENGNPLKNVQKIKDLFSYPDIIAASQQHGSVVTPVEILPGDAVVNRPECDGLMTNQTRQPLMVRHADCQAACFFDPCQQAIAMVHCGWRGNVQNIYLKTIQNMRKFYGTDPANLLVCLSPSLGPERSEFIHYRTEFPESFWQFQYKPDYFDLWALSEWQLLQAGILPHHMQIARLSTWENSEDFFSYRRSKITGCHASVAMLL